MKGGYQVESRLATHFGSDMQRAPFLRGRRPLYGKMFWRTTFSGNQTILPG